MNNIKYRIYLDDSNIESLVNSFLDKTVSYAKRYKKLAYDTDNYYESFNPILYQEIKKLDENIIKDWFNYFTKNLNDDIINNIKNEISELDNQELEFVFNCVYIYGMSYIYPNYLGKLPVVRM